ncbi:putative epoxide hydrolase 2 [Rosellinia necatrix]|uniref:Putative epoxide hydrolase 2 n=1 Tax=Rosellinia necatrix TaxID=77044 RepID=A0A1W2TCR3_ROSNE|nr:putative epoxide hydrolase 2 [Rosellinia necatrix]
MQFALYVLAQAAILAHAQGACAPAGDNQTVSTKTLVTTDGYTYAYDYVAAANASTATILLLHGFPASRHDWENTVPALTAQGYGVVAPDLLGFGDSSRPTEPEAYNLKAIAGHMAEILDAEGLGAVVGVAHDAGANVLSRATTWIPERFTKLVFVTVPYAPAGSFFDVDAINAQSLEARGYAQFGYWYFFNSWDAPGIISRNLDSFFSLIWPADESAWGTNFATLGAARAWLAANKTTELPSWVTPEYKARWMCQFSRPNVTTSTLNYYRELLRGVDAADESVLTDEDRMLRVPVLAVGSGKDQVATPDLQPASIEPWAVAGFEQQIVDSGHWIMQEKGDELNDILIEFIGRE